MHFIVIERHRSAYRRPLRFAQGTLLEVGPRFESEPGMQDWYLVRQLHNFQRGIRGAHPDDLYGFQMLQMADILQNDQAVNDVVAYINTLQQSGGARLAMNSGEEE